MSKRTTAFTILHASRLLRVLESLSRWQGLVTLTYHRIGDVTASPLDHDVFSASQDDFDAQIALLKRETDLVDPADVPEVLRRGKGRHTLVTFDDGYRDNYDLALPVLQRHNARAVFFMTTGYIGGTCLPWWDDIAWMVRSSTKPALRLAQWRSEPITLEGDRERGITSLKLTYLGLAAGSTAGFLDAVADATGSGRAPSATGADLWMTWDMVRNLANNNQRIGAHTVNHPRLATLSTEDQEREITGSRDRLTAELGTAPTMFAYPYGYRGVFTPTTKHLVAGAGFDVAFSFYGGFARRDHPDRYNVPRVHVGATTPLPMVRALVTVPRVMAIERPGMPRVLTRIRKG